MVGDFGYVLTMPWGSSIYSSSDQNALWWEIGVGLAPWLEEEDDEASGHLLDFGEVVAWGSLPAMTSIMAAAGGVLLLSSSSFLFSSFLFSSPSLVLWFPT